MGEIIAKVRGFLQLFACCRGPRHADVPALRTSLVVVAASLLFCVAGPEQDAVDRVLAGAGLTRKDLQLQAPADNRPEDPSLVLPLVRALLQEPWGAGNEGQVILHSALASAPSLGGTVGMASERLLGVAALAGWAASRESEEVTLAGAVALIQEEAGMPLSAEQRSALAVRSQVVPSSIARRAALLLGAARQARKLRDRAFERLADPKTAAERLLEFRERGVLTPQTLADFRDLDLGSLLAAAGILADAADAALALPRDPIRRSFKFEWDSPWGRISVRGPGRDAYPAADYLLILDSAGDDRYQGGAATSARAPISIILDLGGDDSFTNGPASGSLGCALLVDVFGNDRYGGSENAVGNGFFGTGVLWDRQGNDQYTLRRRGQGAGEAGLGLLIDSGGDDRYSIVQAGQGFGGIRGAGILIDVDGDDRYTADDTHIDFPSSQTPRHNDSMAQGAGSGQRGAAAGDPAAPGGIGMLVDGDGDDRYSAGVFAQGVGYFHAAGLLLDAGGNDRYRGVWYCQGAAAHSAAGLLLDTQGGDRYRAEMNTAMGAGHDRALGRLDDLQGNDTYSGGDLLLGAASDGGVGVFWDRAGSDRYAGTGSLLLGAATLTPGLGGDPVTTGLFLDTGGTTDRYQRHGRASQNSRWRSPEGPARGAGLDE